MITLPRRVAPRTPLLARGVLSLCSLLCLTALVPVSTLNAQLSGVSDARATQPGTIEGTLVVRDSNRPAVGVTVTIRESGTSVTTDDRGRYHFDSVMPGTYTIIATGENYGRTRITDVVVRPGSDLTLSRQAIASRSPNQEPIELEDYVVSAKQEGVLELDPYEVSGRKEKPFTTNMDIPRTINDAQPYYIFDAKTIDQSAAVNIEDLLKQRLTMNTVAQTNSQVSGQTNPPLGNTSSINLRGLGADKTLILVNGRRLAGVTVISSGVPTNNQPDLNGIPLSAIERIEVLPSSASGIYGGSAVGGVVNVILKDDYQGGEIRATYDNTWNSDSPRRSLSANFGLSLEGGRTHIMLNASWSDAKPLLLQDRAWILRENLARIQANAPTFLQAVRDPFLGSLPNIVRFAGTFNSDNTIFTPDPLVLKTGQSLNSGITYVPAGTSSNTSATELAAGLLANAGKWNMDFPPTVQFPTGLLRQFGSTPETRSFQARLRRQMASWLEISASYSWNKNHAVAIDNPTGGIKRIQVSASNPNNPFTTTVIVVVPDSTQSEVVTQSENRNANIGFVAQLPWGWTGALDYTWSENKFSYDYLNLGLETSYATDIATGAINPFVDTLLYPIDWQKYYVKNRYAGSNQLDVFALRGSGPLFDLPWGQPTLTTGLEHRRSHIPERTIRTELPITVANSRDARYYARNSVTDSGYAELTAPLVKSAWIPGINALDFQASGRIERFEVDTGTYGAATFFNRTPPTVNYLGPTAGGQPFFGKASYTANNYTVGLKYQPAKDFTLRLSRATAFLPPTPEQLLKDAFPSTTTTNVIDRQTGLLTPVFTLSGGNPDLKPQNSKSLNAGIIWQPTRGPLKGMRVNVEYYKIEQFDAIATLQAQAIVDNEDLFPGRIARDNTGAITLVDVSMVNLYHRETEGWDLNVNYALKTGLGTFNLDVVQTIIRHLKSQYSQTLPEFDAAGFHPADLGGAPKYRGSGTVSWEHNGWTASWTTRHIGAYKQLGVAGGPSSLQNRNGSADMTYITPQGGDSIASQRYHDVYVGYAFGKVDSSDNAKSRKAAAKALDGLTVQVGMRNVFDKVPPFDAYYSSNYYLSPFGDVRLRSYWLSVRKSF